MDRAALSADPRNDRARRFPAVARLLLQHGARTNIKDILWHATPAEWAKHEGHAENAALLQSHSDA